MSTRQEKRRFHAPVWLQWLGNVFSFIVLCASALAAIVLIIIPFATGSQTYSVLTSSMAPNYPPGTFLVVKPTDFDSLQLGDVITYQVESGRPDVITHRITGFTAAQDGERLLITQGDNNDVADENPIMDIQVRGKLFYAVPYVGFVANALGQTDRGWLTTALAIALIGYGLVSMVRGVIRDRKDQRELQDMSDAGLALDMALRTAEVPRATAISSDPETTTDPAAQKNQQ